MVETLAERRAKYAAPALDKGLDLLEHLAEQAQPMTQAELARALGRQPGEIFRMLTVLEARGYLRREPDSGRYALTLKLFELSRTHSPFEELLKTARPLMQALTEEIGESCHLSVIHRDQVMVLAQEETGKAFRLSVEIGSLHPPMSTTSGRVMLAHLPDGELQAALEDQAQWRKLDAAGRKAFLERLATIRAVGHETTEGERFIGAMDLGVLVGSETSSIKAALTIATLRQKDGPGLDAMIAPLTACAREIGARAGLIGEDGA